MTPTRVLHLLHAGVAILACVYIGPNPFVPRWQAVSLVMLSLVAGFLFLVMESDE